MQTSLQTLMSTVLHQSNSSGSCKTDEEKFEYATSLGDGKDKNMCLYRYLYLKILIPLSVKMALSAL